MKALRETGISFLTLFLSLGTLLCCVLPLIFVTLGMGAVIASLISQFPILVTLSQYKLWIFIAAAVFLLITAWLLWRPSECPANPKLAKLCNQIQTWNKRIFWAALVIWIIGFSITYMVLPAWIWLEG